MQKKAYDNNQKTKRSKNNYKDMNFEQTYTSRNLKKKKN
jgi:hypothetical protein